MCSKSEVTLTIYDPSKTIIEFGNNALSLASAPNGFALTLYHHGVDALGLDTLIQQYALVIPHWLIGCCVCGCILGVGSLVLVRKRRKTHPRTRYKSLVGFIDHVCCYFCCIFAPAMEGCVRREDKHHPFHRK